MADTPYEGTPGALQLVGIAADTQGLAVYLASPGALLLLGLTATVILPIQRVLNPDLPSGVRGRPRARARSLYPKLVVVYDKRYTVRSRQEELTLLNRLSDEKGEKKKVAPPKAPAKAKTVYTIRRR